MKQNKGASLWFFRKGGWRACLCLLLAAATFALYMACPAGLRADISAGKIYTLSDVTEDALSSLQTDVSLLLVADGEQDPRLTELLARYSASSERIDTAVITPAQSVYYAGSEQTAGSVIVTNGVDTMAVAPDAMYRTSDVAAENGTAKTVTWFTAEQEITSAVAFVAADRPLACVMQGHGETAYGPAFQTLLAEAGYHIRNIYLSENSAIPDTCALILCNVPLIDLTNAETEALIEAISNGVCFFLTTDSQYAGTLPNLERVMQSYGLQTVPGLVVESDAQHYYMSPYYLLPVTAQTALTGTLSAFGIPALVGMAHAIEPVEGTEAEITPLLQTTPEAYIKPNAYTDGIVEYAEGDKTGTFTIGAAAELPQGGKVFWVASSQYLEDSINSAVLGANYLLAGSALEWMQTVPVEPVGEIEPAVLEEQLSVPSYPAAYIGLFAAIPLVALAVGAIVVFLRKRGQHT